MGNKRQSGDLFSASAGLVAEKSAEALAPDAVLLHHFAYDESQSILDAIIEISAAAPFRHMATRGGHRMSVAMTNCGRVGWTSDETGYRYTSIDPESGHPWPGMPPLFFRIAQTAAAEAGFKNFDPDACLVNRYEPGAKMGAHQDKDEQNFDAPIVSLSLGLPATFLFGGPRRSDAVKSYRLESGDVVVWGGAARLHYHGIATLRDGEHTLTGSTRYNLTFRKAL